MYSVCTRPMLNSKVIWQTICSNLYRLERVERQSRPLTGGWARVLCNGDSDWSPARIERLAEEDGDSKRGVVCQCAVCVLKKTRPPEDGKTLEHGQVNNDDPSAHEAAVNLHLPTPHWLYCGRSRNGPGRWLVRCRCHNLASDCRLQETSSMLLELTFKTLRCSEPVLQ